jgi:CHAT domain
VVHRGMVTGQREERPALCPFLQVEATSRVLRFRFDPVGLPSVAAFEEFGEYYVEPETIGALQSRVDALLRGGERPGVVVDARVVGQALYRLLLPEQLRERLAEMDGPLVIHATGLSIPWELLHDGREFWGITHQLARAGTARPAVAHVPPVMGSRPRVLLVGSDPDGTLPFVEQEIAELAHAFGSFAEVVVVSGAAATMIRVRMRFQGRYDIVHVCGAGTTGATDGLALLVADGSPVPLASLSETIAGEPLIVLDLCAAERGGDRPMERRWGERLGEAACACLAAGALGVIGNVSPVSDRNATRLLRGLYAQLCSGADLGDALRRARIETRSARSGKRSATWASFVLYGHPCSAPSPALLQGARVFVGSGVDASHARRLRHLARTTRPRYVPLVALLVLVAGVWLLVGRSAPTRVQIVIGERADDPDISRTMTNAIAVLRDGLESLAARNPEMLEVVPAHQLLCDGRSGAHCLALLNDVRRTLRLVVTPSRAPEGGYLAILRLTALRGDGSTALAADVSQRMGTAEALNTGLLSKVVQLLNVGPVPTVRVEPETPHAYDLLRQSMVGTMAEVVESGATPVALPRPARFTWRRAQSPPDARAGVEGFLGKYADALSARSLSEVAARQPDMSDTQRAALARYFDFAQRLTVSFRDVRLHSDRDRVLLTAWRHDEVEPPGVGVVRLKSRVAMLLQRYGSGWFIVDQQHAARRWQLSRRRLESVLSRPAPAKPWTFTLNLGRALDLPPDPTTRESLWSDDFNGNSSLSGWKSKDVSVEHVGNGEREATVLRIAGAFQLLLPDLATAVRADRLVLMARSTGPSASTVQIRFPTVERDARFWQAITVSPDSWQEISLPLRYFRWNHPAVPTWEEVDRLELRTTGGAELLLARVQLIAGQLPLSAYLSPHEIIAIAFPERAGSEVRVLKGKPPWLIATDAPKLDIAQLLPALDSTYRTMIREFPSLPLPRRPVVLLVFADSGEYTRFWSRFRERFEMNSTFPAATGRAFMGVATASYDESWTRDARYMLNVCVHEATHALGTQMLGLAGGSRWLFEGMAERYGRVAAGLNGFADVQTELYEHGIPSVADLLANAPTPPNGYLPAALMVEWLLADPLRRSQLPALLHTMRVEAVTDLRLLAERHLGLTVEKLEDAWHRWLHSRYGVPVAG